MVDFKKWYIDLEVEFNGVKYKLDEVEKDKDGFWVFLGKCEVDKMMLLVKFE